uniref:DUF3830 family protein n=1 Tax=Sphingosinicella rhizophila TaxID=3050082 RepID=UPI00396576A0
MRHRASSFSIPAGSANQKSFSPIGRVRFASKLGQLAGNCFLTITEGLDQLPELGRLTLWERAQAIRFELA